MVTHACNPSTQDAEAGELLQVRGQPGLYNEFQDREILSHKQRKPHNYTFIVLVGLQCKELAKNMKDYTGKKLKAIQSNEANPSQMWETFHMGEGLQPACANLCFGT